MQNQISFDDLGFNGKLAIVDGSNNYEWLEPTITSFPSEGYIRLQIVGDEGEGDENARKLLRDHLAQNYLIDIPCDFQGGADLSRAIGEAVAMRDRFLSGNYDPFNA